MTLLDTIRLIESLAAAQPAVRMIVRQDARRLNDCPDALYGAFAWVQGTHTRTGEDSIAFSLSLFYIDRLTADRRNETLIQSTGVEVLDNVIRGLEDSDGVYGVTDVAFTPFDYRFADECAGVYATVRVEVAVTGGTCPEDYEGYESEIKII
jgi:hypothetical protein